MHRPSCAPLFVRILAGAGLTFACQGIASAADDVPYKPITAKELFAGINDGALAVPGESADRARQWELSTARATAYILGVADRAGGREWCAPKSLSGADMFAAVYHYLEGLPEQRLADPAAGIVTSALAKAYPCK